MSTRLKMRRGPNVPSTAELEVYEMGLNTANDSLYVNDNGTIVMTNANRAESIMWSTGTYINATEFVRNNDGDQVIMGNLTLGDSNTPYELLSTALSARYADLAEYYETDATYEAGDILMVSVDYEATLANGKMPIMGVCSTNPGFVMNNDIATDHFAPIALKGRVPVKITGGAERGDFIVLGDDGKGKAVDTLEGIDKEREYIGVCITEGEDVCEVKV